MGNCCDSKPAVTEDKAFDKVEDEESEEDDNELLEEPPQVVSKKMRTSVSAEAYGAWNKQDSSFTPPVHQKTEDQKRRIAEGLSRSWIFQDLEGKNLESVILAFQLETFAAGAEIIKQYDTDAEKIYLIEKGTLTAFKKKSQEEEGRGTEVFTYEGKGVFGELAMLYNCPRAATVAAKSESTLWVLDRSTFNHMVKTVAQAKRRQIEDFLATVEILSTLSTSERAQLNDAIQSRAFKSGQEIITQGQTGDEFFILESGTAAAYKDGEVVKKYEKAGEYFGELALIRGDLRAATVKATSDARVLSLQRQAFKRLCGCLEGILKERAASQYEKFVGA